ncbi:MAG: agmatine deiminase [Acidobacteria bacterium]|nr:MAG: agmatine deiminase [Acidobacteriota bacterium]
MPAEWEPHQATWISWPHNREDWPGKFAPVPWVYVEIVRHLHQSERVCILVEDREMENRVKRMLSRAVIDLSRICFFRFPTNRVWIRDYGPIFVRKQGDGVSEIATTNWKFTAWAKYSNWKKDNSIPSKIAKALKLAQWEPHASLGRIRQPIVLEGGSIEVNGKGTLVTTEECLLSAVQQRNPRLSRSDLEEAFGRYLGIRKVLWLRKGIAGDDTHGHVDDLARFVNANTLVVVAEDKAEDANYSNLKENMELVQSMSDQDGKPLEIVPLPMPNPVHFNGRRLPASYANFYIANKVVLVPTFNDSRDRVALSILAQLFPRREVIGIHSLDLVWGLGAMHCLTQQQPL